MSKWILGKPYLAGGLMLALITSHGRAYWKGRSAGAASAQARYAKATDQAMAAMQRGQERIDALDQASAAASTAQQAETRIIYRETQTLIDRPVYRHACVDGDGIGLLDRAADNANRPLAGLVAG